jgi:CheY-like chemotaxis protein
LLKIKFSTHDFLPATNGREAFDIASKNSKNIALILSDIIMPSMDGEELLVSLRNNETTKNIPVIVLSAYADAPKTIRCKKMANGFVVKPFETSILYDLVSREMLK